MPSSTVTLLFTDIADSTALAERFPHEFPGLLERHHEILREAVGEHGGTVFRIAGDSFAVSFDSALDAVAATVAAQRVLQAEQWQPAEIKVRMGIHTGIADAAALDDEATGYRGYSTLARASRVMSMASGGQVLLSNTSAEQVRSELPRDVTLRDLGEHQLKGSQHPERLWQVLHADLLDEFPRLRSANVAPSNLPVSLTRIVGRTRELAEIKAQLERERLVTLLGTGGTGKTRLALQAAADLREDFDDRVYFADLASSRDVESFLSIVAQCIGLREEGDTTLLDGVKGQIDSQKMLLVLDNFEQVTVAGPTVAELLRECPELKQLVTSREALHVSGEQVLPVPPLLLPPTNGGPASIDEVARSEAVQLFVERARAIKPDFELTPDNARAVAELCVRLDGLPLAIELLTARLNLFSPQALVERLGNRMQLLRGGARDVPERQQTLRAAIDWSYEMLGTSEQRLLALLSVFSGATFDAVEEVCGRAAGCEDIDALEHLSSLVDKSLVRRIDHDRLGPRFVMLETIREFATAKLSDDDGFRAGVVRAHAAYFADWTRAQWPRLTGGERDAASDAMVADLDNIRAAWRCWIAEGNFEELAKITDSLWLLYDVRGWYHAMETLATEMLDLLALTPASPERLTEQITFQTSLARILHVSRGYTQEVEDAYQRALQLCDEAGEVPELVPVLRGLASLHTYRAEFEKGAEIGQQLLALGERLDDDSVRVEGHLVYGTCMSLLDQMEEGLQHLDQGLDIYDPARHGAARMQLGNNPAVVCWIASALISWMLGRPDDALRRALEANALADTLDHPASRAYAVFHLGLIRLWRGEPEAAEECAHSVLDLAEEHGFLIWSAVGTCVRGAALSSTGSPDLGLPMIDEAIVAYQRLKTPPVFWPLLLYLQASACGAAGDPRRGLALLDQAIEIASQGSGRALASEFLRLKGELLLAASTENAAEAENAFRFGIDNAIETGAAMFHVRSALPLARLLQRQGRVEEAREGLTSALGSITEPSQVADFVDARALLAELTDR